MRTLAIDVLVLALVVAFALVTVEHITAEFDERLNSVESLCNAAIEAAQRIEGRKVTP